MTSPKQSRSHYRGCLLGGAIGDALGAPIEFHRLGAIRKAHGAAGVTGFVLAEAYGRRGAITDDTQMTLFTAEGLIRTDNRARDRGFGSAKDVGAHALFRWLETQGVEVPPPTAAIEPGWLITNADLHHRRAPGNTCLSGLQSWFQDHETTPNRAPNSSKGCGGVMRMAPVGLCPLADAFKDGCDLAGLSHGHPTGYIAAGTFAWLISEIYQGRSLEEAISHILANPLQTKNVGETVEAIEHARRLASPDITPETLQELGGGWIAEEALAIGLCAALSARDFEHGVLLAVNHSGDSDSTGSIAGNILGLLHGEAAIPPLWLEHLELRNVIAEVADDMWLHFGEGEEPDAWRERNGQGAAEDWEKYPGN